MALSLAVSLAVADGIFPAYLVRADVTVPACLVVQMKQFHPLSLVVADGTVPASPKVLGGICPCFSR
jgi:hypothetical protein